MNDFRTHEIKHSYKKQKNNNHLIGMLIVFCFGMGYIFNSYVESKIWNISFYEQQLSSIWTVEASQDTWRRDEGITSGEDIDSQLIWLTDSWANQTESNKSVEPKQRDKPKESVKKQVSDWGEHKVQSTDKYVKLKYFSNEAIAQEMVQYAYEVWWIDLITLIECENWWWNTFAKWDGWHAHWLCQMNSNYHDIPAEYFKDRKFQIDYCNQKRLWWTVFYGPSRIVKWVKCSTRAKSQFTFSP